MINTNKTVLLGYNRKSDRYCILTTDFPWEWLEENIKYIDSISFRLYQIDWGGMADIVDICNILRQYHLIKGKSIIILPRPKKFSGTDDDMGCDCDWECEIDTLINVIKKS